MIKRVVLLLTILILSIVGILTMKNMIFNNSTEFDYKQSEFKFLEKNDNIIKFSSLDNHVLIVEYTLESENKKNPKSIIIKNDEDIEIVRLINNDRLTTSEIILSGEISKMKIDYINKELSIVKAESDEIYLVLVAEQAIKYIEKDTNLYSVVVGIFTGILVILIFFPSIFNKKYKKANLTVERFIFSFALLCTLGIYYIYMSK